MEKRISVYDCAIIEFPKILDDRGNLSFLEGRRHIPFDIHRTYWVYDVPGGESRGRHAFRETQECIVALSGSFEVMLYDGMARKIVTLNRAYYGLYVPRMIWRCLQNFSTNSVAFVLTSQPYSEKDYIRDYQEYHRLCAGSNLEQWMTSVNDCKLINLTKIGERKGYITPIYGGDHIPFQISRVYYLYDIPGGATRAGHAHKELQQLMVSIMGSFDVVLDDGAQKKRITLNRPYYGLVIPRLIWRVLENFSSGGICLVHASLPYDENDYIREYANFLATKHKHEDTIS